MNVSNFLQTAYENKHNWTIGENKPIQTQFKPNQSQFTKIPKMNVNSYQTKDYENKPRLLPQQNKPNQTQFQNPIPTLREEKKPSGKLLKKQFFFFPVAKPANAALYGENTDN